MTTETQPPLFPGLAPALLSDHRRVQRILETLTYSGLNTFQTCRRRYLYRYIQGLVPIEKPHALRFGSVTHDWLEAWHRTRSLAGAQSVIDRAYTDRTGDRDEQRDWLCQSVMLEEYARRFGSEDFEVLDLECEFSGPLRNPAPGGRRSRSFQIRGKVDGVIRRGEDVLLLEHKTAATLTGDYLERLAMDLQILLYCHYVRESLGHPVTGILYNVLLKPRLIQNEGETVEQYEIRKAELAAKSKSGKSSAKRRMPESDEDFKTRLRGWYAAEPRFHREELLLDFDSIDNVRQMIWDISKEILEARRTGRWHQNPRSCFGFGRCSYWPICSAMGNSEMVIENLFTRAAAHSELSPGEDTGPSF